MTLHRVDRAGDLHEHGASENGRQSLSAHTGDGSHAWSSFRDSRWPDLAHWHQRSCSLRLVKYCRGGSTREARRPPQAGNSSTSASQQPHSVTHRPDRGLLVLQISHLIQQRCQGLCVAVQSSELHGGLAHLRALNKPTKLTSQLQTWFVASNARCVAPSSRTVTTSACACLVAR